LVLPGARLADKWMPSWETRKFVRSWRNISSSPTLNVEEERGKHPELNSPGGEKLLGDYGGHSMGVPFLVFLDEQGQLLINSNRPVKGNPAGENIGYPALPVEIDWFLTMLQKTLPTLTKADADTIETWLRRASSR
jgi:hypothetical protein